MKTGDIITDTIRFKESKAYKYAEERFCQGKDCAPKTHLFLYSDTVETVAKKYAAEVLLEYKKQNQKMIDKLMELNK